MSLLLTAFEPFGGETVNPAQQAVESLTVPGVQKLILPVEYGRAAAIVTDAITRLSPRAVICVGQAGGRSGITPEKYAVNLRRAKAPDNAGVLYDGQPIVPGGEERLESSFGAERIAQALSEAGSSAYVSESAGTFVCNDVMYSVLKHLSGSKVPAGFIHVPFCSAQAAGHPGAFTMSTEEIARGLAIAVECVFALLKDGE